MHVVERMSGLDLTVPVSVKHAWGDAQEEKTSACMKFETVPVVTFENSKKCVQGNSHLLWSAPSPSRRNLSALPSPSLLRRPSCGGIEPIPFEHGARTP